MGPEEDRRENGPDFRELRADLGLVGDSLIVDVADEAVLRVLPDLLREKIDAEFFGPEQIKALHPAIGDELAQRVREQLIHGLVFETYRMGFDRPAPVGMSDIMQVLSGTRMASMQGLAVVAYALGTTARALLAEARDRSYGNGDAG